MKDDAIDSLLGRTIAGKFEIQELLGTGAMGQVYRARHKGLAKDVAIKVMLGLQRSQPDQVRRFKAEARAAGRLDHPNSVRILDFGEDVQDGLLYIVMELVEGHDLQETLEADGPMGYRRVAWIMSQVFGALSAAHAAEVIHRDMKPGNIMLIERKTEGALVMDFVKVCDFGLAKILATEQSVLPLTAQGAIFGTPAYMSPEQARGDKTDYATDIYACGIVMYKMLTGRTPFKAESPTGVLMKHISEDPPPLSKHRDVEPRIEAIVQRCLQKNPKDRYPSALAARDVLRALLQEDGLPLPPGTGTINPGDPTSVLRGRRVTIPGRRKSELTQRNLPPTDPEVPVQSAEANLVPEVATTVYAATLDPAAAALAHSEEKTLLGTQLDPSSAPPTVESRPPKSKPVVSISPPATSSAQAWAVVPSALALIVGLGLMVYLLSGRQPTRLESDASVPAQTTPSPSDKTGSGSVSPPPTEGTGVADTATSADAKAPSLLERVNLPDGFPRANRNDQRPIGGGPSMPQLPAGKPVPGTGSTQGLKPRTLPAGPFKQPRAQPELGLQLELKKVRVVSGMSNMAAHRALRRHLDKAKACLQPIISGLRVRSTGNIEVHADVTERGRLENIESKGLRRGTVCIRQSFAATRIPAPDTGKARLTFSLTYRMSE